LSLRGTSEAAAAQILDAWLSAPADPGEAENVARLNAIDEEYRPAGQRGALAEGEKGRI
jgi:hypothetical protein